ncbi:MAG: elongation factor P maturation arginine rhamnosyltransferase EarP [Burkholderiales bacterium]|nr:elongation factor P maturation arginine rhamnosyltransferase EarP [Burkholderiales bacterium]
MAHSIDLFCRVIDNYGDIGVCWRLARQLAAEHACVVRLIVDDLHAFRYLAPEIRTDGDARQSLLGVAVVPWAAAASLAPADVVIEGFACDPPDAYVRAMAARVPRPVWLNLEYLSAEPWVEDVHGRPSPHPRLPLTKYFFCPGFTERTGGLIREQSVPAAVPHDAGSTPPGTGLRLFAFTYPQAPARAVADALALVSPRVEVGVAAPLLDRRAEWPSATVVAQPDFDALLAGFDVLLVRGEDSFVRAQWAAKPFLWHIYPTDDGAHLTKLDAWLDRYCNGLSPEAERAYRRAAHAWVGHSATPDDFADFAQQLPALRGHALRWRERLTAQTDLATRLLAFIQTA